jgi:hypothetical protein
MDKTIMEKYHTGYMAQDGKKIADIYEISAGCDIAATFGICFNPEAGSPIWRITATEDTIDISYETIPSGFKYPVMYHVPEDMHEIVMKDIRNTVKKDRKAA